jgi:hypothetical protein
MIKKTACIFICILFFSPLVGTTSNLKKPLEFNNEIIKNEYTHTVFIEIATSQGCQNCHFWSESIYETYNSNNYDFQYVEMIILDHDGWILNNIAYAWESNYNIIGFPTSILDGDFKRIVGNNPSELQDKLNLCGSRNVKDITAEMNIDWLGDATIIVNISIQNNGDSQYDGHIRAPITEIQSRYDTYYNEPYHFGFLDYAFNKEISISPGGIFTDTVTWNGYEHYDTHDNNFGNIKPNNIQVIMGVFNNENNYVDETITTRLIGNTPPNPPNNPSPYNEEKNVDINTDLNWSCSDPDDDNLIYDIFFDTIYPPKEKVSTGQTQKTYNPGTLNNDTTYYWKIVAYDDEGSSTSGPIWSFTTKNNDDKKPNVKITKPNKGFYFFNNKILPRIFRLTKIIGSITIEVEASDDDSDIKKVEFYINNKLNGNDTTSPYSYTWERDHLRLFHIFVIKVIAYDKLGNTAFDSMIVKKFL